MDEIFNNPYYWSNNKRRLNGLRPFRNNKKRIKKIIHSQELFNAISIELEKQCVKEAIKVIDKMANIKDIALGDKI